jgi:DNA polymerase III epsilon subunit family exonuclease
MQKWYESGPFTVFDVETTGMSPVNDRIVELAALRIDTDGHKIHYQSLINPGCLIPSRAMQVHGITDAMVAHEPNFTQVGYDFLELAKDSILVAHNARFDLGFLQESLSRCGLPLWKGKTLDTLRFTKQAYAGLPSYSLQNLRRTFQLDDTSDDMQAHRAAADVEWTAQLLGIVMTELLRRE